MRLGGGFRRPPKPDRSEEFASYTPKPRTIALRMDGPATLSVPVPKTDYVRSDKLMAAYRRIECQHCGRDDGSVAGAHSNWAEHGKGRSIKASDVYCASLCERCHYMLDQGKTLNRAERQAMWLAAHRKTVARLVELGYWPAGIDVPTIEEAA